jgi:hypothetical protein
MVLAEPQLISWIGKVDQICRMITHTIESLRIFLGVNLASPFLKKWEEHFVRAYSSWHGQLIKL